MTEDSQAKKDTSPRAAGPAGPQFEAKVATHLALAVLAQTEAFGLPGAIVDRLEFQRGGLGHPLDDIIVKATTRRVSNAALKCKPSDRCRLRKVMKNLQPSWQPSLKAAKKMPADASPLP
jgi:hypothetical protein